MENFIYITTLVLFVVFMYVWYYGSRFKPFIVPQRFIQYYSENGTTQVKYGCVVGSIHKRIQLGPRVRYYVVKLEEKTFHYLANECRLRPDGYFEYNNIKRDGDEISTSTAEEFQFDLNDFEPGVPDHKVFSVPKLSEHIANRYECNVYRSTLTLQPLKNILHPRHDGIQEHRECFYDVNAYSISKYVINEFRGVDFLKPKPGETITLFGKSYTIIRREKGVLSITLYVKVPSNIAGKKHKLYQLRVNYLNWDTDVYF